MIIGPPNPILWEIVRRIIEVVLKDPKRIEVQEGMVKEKRKSQIGVRKSGRGSFSVDRRWC